jgi:hypothetical protein
VADLLVTAELRAFLVTAGVVRAGETPGAPPACWFNPHEGPKQPVAGETAAVTLIAGLQVPTRVNEAFMEDRIVDVWVRATSFPVGELLQRSIRGLVNDKRNYLMGALLVEHSILWAGISNVPPESGAKIKTYDTRQSFRFMARTAALAGTP